MVHLTEFTGLFSVAFLAATVFPAQSEILLAGMVMAEHYPAYALVAVASAGNVLGSVVNWLLGRFIAHFEGSRWFPLKREQVAKAEGWYQRWGKWSLLLSWAPFVGDPLTIVAGVLREPLPVFVLLVTLAKVGRYIVVAWLADSWVQA
jgi:membrane protein YqaA with SNARE-associated domain